MRKPLIFIVCLAILLSVCGELWSEDTNKTEVDRIIDMVDKLYRSDTSQGEVEMIIQTPNWERTLKMQVWSEGTEKTFIRITYPNKDAGIATLRVGTEMWNFFPKINKVMKVPPSMMMGSWMGSDFTNDDIVKESSLKKDYDGRLVSPDGADPNHYYIELIPHAFTPIVWGKLVFTVQKDDYIPVKEEFYDEKGNLMRVMDFREVKYMGGKKIPSVMEITPLNKKNQKTIIRYESLKFDIKLPQDTFTLRNLQKKLQ